MNAYGAVFAEVAVDELLGTVRIRRVYGSYDAGRIINPKLAHSQAIGGMVGGIGMALLEDAHLDHRDGRVVNANMSDYLVPVNADVPALDANFLPGEDTIAAPWASRDSANWSSSACRPPSPTRCSTRRADASPTCPSRWKSCCNTGLSGLNGRPQQSGRRVRCGAASQSEVSLQQHSTLATARRGAAAPPPSTSHTIRSRP